MAVNVLIKNSVFNKLYRRYLMSKQRIQIFFGGASSGKSVFLAQRCINDLMIGGRNYLIVRQTRNSLADSVFNELQRVINRWEVKALFNINQSRMTITCKNGYAAFCRGLDDPEKLKSVVPKKGALTDIWIEEATETKLDDIKNLVKRLRGEAKGIGKRITFSFNPILKTHWIYKEHFKEWKDDDRVFKTKFKLILHSTYKDNSFLDKDDIKALEDESDEYFYNVYTLGKWGVLGDLIFNNWKVKDIKGNEELFKTFDLFRNGLDFGFSTSPTAFNRMYYHKATRHLYIVDEWHEFDVTNDQIARGIKPLLNGDYLACDSAEPKSIKELKNHGINAGAAKKGPDSILHGIQWLKQQKIIIDQSCVHTKLNFEQYHWEKDRKTGERKMYPADRDNDHIDNIRYAMEDYMIGPAELEITTGDSQAANDVWNF